MTAFHLQSHLANRTLRDAALASSSTLWPLDLYTLFCSHRSLCYFRFQSFYILLLPLPSKSLPKPLLWLHGILTFLIQEIFLTCTPTISSLVSSLCFILKKFLFKFNESTYSTSLASDIVFNITIHIIIFRVYMYLYIFI